MSHFPGDLRRPESAKSRLKDLLLQIDNQLCADCGAPDPKWASANIGVFICLKCSGVHRSLGTHVSKVGGNGSANAIYEAFIPDGYTKPGPSANHEERSNFIRSKYELQEFLKPSLRIVSNNSSKSSEEPSYFQEITDSFRSSSSSKKSPQEGMIEFMGLLKVKVIEGTNLAVRDVKTSDPFVTLTLGQQTAKTTVIKSNLNPVWNEELMLSVPLEYGPLKLQVFDHDIILSNDLMGEAEIDLQPMITSAIAFGDAEMLENMQIGKWLKSDDNALVNDSAVVIVDGKVKQEVSLKLQNVESGEVHLELEWIPIDQ
uniref:ADP-ribosylation factor GTPase-activating protein AGD12-like n=1 Tax=Cucumis sativus TaxID=3659 RepID=A0A0A0LY16_CUCSA